VNDYARPVRELQEQSIVTDTHARIGSGPGAKSAAAPEASPSGRLPIRLARPELRISPRAVRTPVDLSDPDLYSLGDPHAVWSELRRTRPVCWNEEANGPGFWAVTDYACASEVYRRPDIYSSARGIMLRPDRTREDAGGGVMLALTDPPRHSQLRARVNRAFTPRTVARLQANATRIVRRLLTRALEQGDCEFVNEIAGVLPVLMTCDLMGVPEADWPLLYRLTRQAFGFDDVSYRTSESASRSAARAHTEIMVYYRGLVEERRRAPREDIVSALASASIDGATLSTREAVLNCDNIHVAGHETARHAIAGGVLALANSPEQWYELRRQGGAPQAAVEELLRWTTPGMHVMRTARTGTWLGGVSIEGGDTVVVWNASANRDENQFCHPERLDLTRSRNRHLALGVGSHYCLGAALARMELRTFFSEFARMVRRVEPTGPICRLRSNAIQGYTSMPVRLEAA
jgi:cytochrome P450